MSRVLKCDMKMYSPPGSSEKWPVVFETLKAFGFQFSSPYLSEQMGRFLYNADPSSEDWVEMVGPVSLLNECISARQSVGTATFWWVEEQKSLLSLDVTWSFDAKHALRSFLLEFAGGDIADVAERKAIRRLKHFFSCMNVLCEQCLPVEADIHWENATVSFAPWAVVGNHSQMLDQESKGQEKIICNNQRLITLTLSQDLFLFVLEPVPVMRGKTQWKCLSLFSPE